MFVCAEKKKCKKEKIMKKKERKRDTRGNKKNSEADLFPPPIENAKQPIHFKK